MPKISPVLKAPATLFGASPVWVTSYGADFLVYADISANILYFYNSTKETTVTLDFTVTEYKSHVVGFITPDRFGLKSTHQTTVLVGLSAADNRTSPIIARVSVADPPAIVSIISMIVPEQALVREHRFDCAQFCPGSTELYVGFFHPNWIRGDIGQLLRFKSDESCENVSGKLALCKSSGLTSTPHYPKSIAWCNSKKFYLVDAAQAEISMISFTSSSSSASSGSRFMTDKSPRVVYLLKEEYVQNSYVLGGIAIDRKGTIWAALTGAAAILRIDPITGEEMYKLRLDVDYPIAVTFGGPRLDHLYITSRSTTSSLKTPLCVAYLDGVRGLGDDCEVVDEDDNTKGGFFDNLFCGFIC